MDIIHTNPSLPTRARQGRRYHYIQVRGQLHSPAGHPRRKGYWTPAEINTVPHADELVIQGLLQKLTFNYSTTALATEGLKTYDEGDAGLQDILLNLRQELTTGHFTL